MNMKINSKIIENAIVIEVNDYVYLYIFDRLMLSLKRLQNNQLVITDLDLNLIYDPYNSKLKKFLYYYEVVFNNNRITHKDSDEVSDLLLKIYNQNKHTVTLTRIYKSINDNNICSLNISWPFYTKVGYSLVTPVSDLMFIDDKRAFRCEKFIEVPMTHNEVLNLIESSKYKTIYKKCFMEYA